MSASGEDAEVQADPPGEGLEHREVPVTVWRRRRRARRRRHGMIAEINTIADPERIRRIAEAVLTAE